MACRVHFIFYVNLCFAAVALKAAFHSVSLPSCSKAFHIE